MISNADCDDKDTSTNNNRSTGVVDLHEIVTNSMRQKSLSFLEYGHTALIVIPCGDHWVCFYT